MLRRNHNPSSFRNVVAILAVVASACGSDQPKSPVEPAADSPSISAISVVDGPVVSWAPPSSVNETVPPVVSVLEVSLTFEATVRSSPLVLLGEIVSVGDGVEWNSKSGDQWEYTEAAADTGRVPYEFQRLTIEVVEVLKNGGEAPDLPRPGQEVTVAVPTRGRGLFLGETVGGSRAVGLRVLIVGQLKGITFQDGETREMVLARPSATYVELPSASGEPTRGVRLWTAYSDRRTLASRGELSAAALAAMPYADAPEFSDLLARIPGADTRPREQHLGYDQVTRTTLPQPPPGNEP